MEQKVKSRKTALYTTLEVFLLLIMTIVGNMWDWVHMTFNPQAVTTMEFWQSVMIKSVLYTCSLLIGILLKMQKLELKDARYDELYGQYRKHLPFKNQHKDDFTNYVDKTLNPSIKKEYIRTKLNARLMRIQKHERDSWLQDYFRAKETGKGKEYEFSGWFGGFFSRRYYIKRRRIEEMLEGDFIDKNYEYIHCKYPRISAAVFTYYLDVKRNRDDKYKVLNEAPKDISKKGTLKAAQTVMMGIVITVFALQPQANELLAQANGWIVLLIEYIIRVFMMTGSFAMGVYTAKRVFSDNYLLPLTNRIDILEDFEIWFDKNPVRELGVEAVKEQAKDEMKAEFEKWQKAYKDEVLKETEEIINQMKRENDRIRGTIN